MKWISLTGIVPFVGGWMIFLTWLVARFQFALNLRSLESIGGLSLVGSFFIAISGLVLFAIYVFSKKVKWRIKYLWVVAVILVNIPSVNFILNKVIAIQELTFVKIENNSNDQISLRLISKMRTSFKTVESGSYTVIYYKPTYLDEYSTESERVEMKVNSMTDTLLLPNFYSGRCVTLTLNRNFEIAEP